MLPYLARRIWISQKVGLIPNRLPFTKCLIFHLGTIPEPTAVLTARQSTRMPPPRSKSPIKTFLQSPARRNPSLGPISSPIRGSIIAPRTATVTASVRRKLDFSAEDLETNVFEPSATKGSPQKRADSISTKATSKLTNGKGHLALKPSAFSYEDERDDAENMGDDTALHYEGDSFQMINGGDDEDEVAQVEEQPESEPEPEPELDLPKKGRGRPKAKGKEKAVKPALEPEPEVESEREAEQEVEVEPEPVNKAAKKGRAKTRKEPPAEFEERPAKKTRRSLESAEALPKHSAKGKSTKPATVSKGKAISKKPKLAAIAEADSPNIQHAPPLPRNNRGLFILRRETPMEGNGFKQSRYGRNSVKPVAWWKNERIEYSEDEAEDGDNKFLLSRIKEVVRRDEVEDTRPKRAYKPSKGKGKKRAALADEGEDDEAEAWEADPGRIYAEIRQWDPDDQVGAEAEEEEQEVAWSSAAIITKDVAGANFGFAKCLTMPFFGAGMVDFPVGAIKHPKNSRKMQMVFFVYTGRVQVTINGSEPFRISKGGMWQVPRGNAPLPEHIERD